MNLVRLEYGTHSIVADDLSFIGLVLQAVRFDVLPNAGDSFGAGKLGRLRTGCRESQGIRTVISLSRSADNAGERVRGF